MNPPESPGGAVPPEDGAVADTTKRVPGSGRVWPAGTASPPWAGHFVSINRIDRTNPNRACRIGHTCLHGVREANGLFAVVDGWPPDGGVRAELGTAIAWRKPVLLLPSEFQHRA